MTFKWGERRPTSKTHSTPALDHTVGAGEIPKPKLTSEEKRRLFVEWQLDNEDNPLYREDVSELRRLSDESASFDAALDRAGQTEFKARVIDNPAVVRDELKESLANPVSEQQVEERFDSQYNSSNPGTLGGGALGFVSAYGIATNLLTSLRDSGPAFLNPDYPFMMVPSILLTLTPFLLVPAGILIGSYLWQKMEIQQIRDSLTETVTRSLEHKSTKNLLIMVENVCEGASSVGVGDRIPQDRATGIKTSLLAQEITSGNQRLSELGRQRTEREKSLIEKAGLA